MKKIFKILASMLTCVFLITGCGKSEDPGTSEGCKEEMTLEDLNKMLNDADKMNMDLANTVAIIPFNHINGPRNEWKFYALVNFQYKELSYAKYQVTYLSCTCRAATYNYWQTAYMEITTTQKDPQKAKLRALSFDQDGSGHYTAGFWGDSSPITAGGKIITTYDEYVSSSDNSKSTFNIGIKQYTIMYDESNPTVISKISRGEHKYDVTNSSFSIDGVSYTITYDSESPVSVTDGTNTYNINTKTSGIYIENQEGLEDGYYYPTIKNEFIEDLLVGKTHAQIDAWNTVDDMLSKNAMSQDLFDAFTGASVSTNNILRILHAVFDYHTATWWE